MDEEDLRAFGDRWRLELLERLVLKSALIDPVLNGLLSLEDSRQTLVQWLDTQTQSADVNYGKHFRDPAMAALYADEVRDVIEKMKSLIDKLYAEMKAIYRDRGIT